MAYADDVKITAKTRSRRWCFTSFDETAPTDDGSIQYMCYQRETAPTTGRRHWQGYVEFNGSGGIGIAAVQKRLGIKCHLTLSRGTADQNRTYCSKLDGAIAGTFKEIGEPGNQGDRTDIKEFHELIQEGATDEQLAGIFPKTYMRMYRGVSALRRALMPKRIATGPMPECYWIHGPPGSGKSRWVYDNYDAKEIFAKNNSKWWDGYLGQRVVVINEFKFGGDVNMEYLLNLTDRYPFTVEDKGGSLPMGAMVIILTSNDPPEKILGADHWERWKRRFTFIDTGKGEKIALTGDDIQAFFETINQTAAAPL